MTSEVTRDTGPGRLLAAIAVVTLLCAAIAVVGHRPQPLRVAVVAADPLQSLADPATGNRRGPGPALSHELAERLGTRAEMIPRDGVAGVIESLTRGEADVGLFAVGGLTATGPSEIPAPPEPQRLAIRLEMRGSTIEFCGDYALVQHTYLVRDGAPFRSVTEVGGAGVTIGITDGDPANLVVTSSLRGAGVRINPAGTADVAADWVMDGTVDAYAASRLRLAAIAAAHPGLRVLADDFWREPQTVAVATGNTALCAAAGAAIDAARERGDLARAIARAGLVGVAVAPRPDP